MKCNPVHAAIIVCAALFLGAVVLPLSLHTLSLRQIRNATFSAVRFAAEKDPATLVTLPVTRWHEDPQPMAAAVYRTAWEQYELRIPRNSGTIIADVDLRSTMTPLFLGAGGWLRVLLGIAASGALAWWGLRHLHRPSRVHSAGHAVTAAVSAAKAIESDSMLHAALQFIPEAAVIFSSNYHVLAWNVTLQCELPKLKFQPGLHLLDVAEHLSWGSTLLEKIDDAVIAAPSAWSTLMVVRKGDSLCVSIG